MENAIARKLDPPEINPIEIESVLLNRLASVGQKSYAEHMGISESTVSRRKAEGYFCNMAKELAFLGIQAAPAGSGTGIQKLSHSSKFSLMPG
ncbi:hypothetical protein RB531_1059 [Salmonella enterica subsp. enterica serovar Typhimurium]